jgi:hypothetical protein
MIYLGSDGNTFIALGGLEMKTTIATLLGLMCSAVAAEPVFFEKNGIMYCVVAASYQDGKIEGFWQREMAIPKNGILQINETIQMKDEADRFVTVPLKIEITRREESLPPAPGIPKPVTIMFNYRVQLYNFVTNKVESLPVQDSESYGEFGFTRAKPTPNGVINNVLECFPESFFRLNDR